MENTTSGVAYGGYFQEFYSNRSWEHYSFLICQVINYSKPGVVLDLGSGCGFFIEACSRWGIECLGIEASKEAIDLMDKRFSSKGIFNHGLEDSFSIENGTIQTVVLNQVIEHLPPETQENCLAESFRVLKKGGALIIHSPSKHNKIEKHADPTHINLLSPSELHKMLTMHGFQNLIDINSTLNGIGNTVIERKFFSFLYKTFKMDRLSLTASFIAYK